MTSIYNKYMLEFISYITKYYHNFYEIASISLLKNLMIEFDLFFNEENKIKILEEKQDLINKGYTEISFNNKDDVDFIEIFYNNLNYVKNYYLDIQVNHIDKNFIIYKQNKN